MSSDYGNYTDIMEEIYTDIITQKVRNGEVVTPKLTNEIRSELFEMYQKVLFVAQEVEENKGDFIGAALRNMQVAIQRGNTDITSIRAMADDTISKTLEGKRDYQLESTSNSNIQISSIVYGGLILNESTQELKNNLCTSEMESDYKAIYEKAMSGDKNALVVADIIRKATNYLTSKDKLNPKGKDKGAISLIVQLLDTNDKGASLLAQEMLKQFGLEDRLAGRELDSEVAHDMFKEMLPSHNISQIEKSHRTYIDTYAPLVKENMSASYSDLFDSMLFKKMVTEFSREYNRLLSEGRDEAAQKLAKKNPELYEKMEKNQIVILENIEKRKKCEKKHRDSLEYGLR